MSGSQETATMVAGPVEKVNEIARIVSGKHQLLGGKSVSQLV